jgi:regulation of enolase protein 1 (concanavalin A-like superfamily)
MKIADKVPARAMTGIEAFGTSGWEWLNPPRRWSAGEDLQVTTDPDTDFWRTTHYGYVCGSGHVFGRRVEADLRLTVAFQAGYADQYDQAGAALWIDEKNWIKTGTELVDGRHLLSVVVTRDVSDWSVLPLDRAPEQLTLAIHRAGDAVTVTHGETMLRLAYFPPGVPALAGAMCASPTGGGFAVRFSRVELEPG